MTEHSVNLSNRNEVKLTGVVNVMTFDEEEVILESSMGFLAIEGAELHITMLNLDEGKVEIQGKVNNIAYKPQGGDLKGKGKNVINRLFK